jgi:hypothetical protein
MDGKAGLLTLFALGATLTLLAATFSYGLVRATTSTTPA